MNGGGLGNGLRVYMGCRKKNGSQNRHHKTVPATFGRDRAPRVEDTERLTRSAL